MAGCGAIEEGFFAGMLALVIGGTTSVAGILGRGGGDLGDAFGSERVGSGASDLGSALGLV